MISLRKGETQQFLTVTLNEFRTLESGYYLFVFTHILTYRTVALIFSFADDQSGFQDRYNRFEINTDTVFSGYPEGQYKYQVYEQQSATNVDPAGLHEVERGILILQPQTDFMPEAYHSETTFKAYNG